jgi:integrase
MKLSHELNRTLNTRWRKAKDAEGSVARVRKVIAALGDLDTTEYTSEALTALFDSWNLAPSSRNRYLGCLGSCGVSVRYCKVEPTEARVLTSQELEALDARVRAQDNPRCQAVYAILRDTGCRGDSELHRLQPSSVDWENRTVKLESFKGRHRVRTVPLSDIAYNALAWMYHEGWVMPTRGQWRSFWLRVRLDDQNKPYDLRHTFCTRLLDAGAPPVTVMRIMGHHNLEQTLHYFHQRSQALDDIRDQLNAVLRSPQTVGVR